MRHIEEFEIEHLLNSTGSLLFRLRSRSHLKSCELCRRRMETVIERNAFARKLRDSVRNFERFNNSAAPKFAEEK